MSQTLSLENFRDLDSWLDFHGFRLHPFEESVAERENYLNGYFIAFPYFEEIAKPKTTFLFLNRGSGKTANRLMIQKQCDRTLKRPQSVNLGVPYTDFYRLMQQDKVSLEDHTEAILREVVPKFFDLLIQPHHAELVTTKLSPDDLEDLVWFLERYSDALSQGALERQILQISHKEDWSQEQTSDMLKNVSRLSVDALSAVVGTALPGTQLLLKGIATLLDAKNQFASDVVIAGQERYHSPLDIMSRFGEIAMDVEVPHIYILIDRVDEYAPVQDFEAAATMLKPLLQVVPFLEIKPYAYKFFLPAEVMASLKPHFRQDKFPVYSYDWQPEDLQRVLERRLEFCCDPQLVPNEAERRSFSRLLDKDDFQDIDIMEELVKQAEGSPRKLIQLAKAIFDEHTRISEIAPLIIKETYHRAIKTASTD